MKKILFGFVAVLLLFLAIGMVYAVEEDQGTILQRLSDHPGKICIAYNFDSHQKAEGIGGAAKKDIFGLKDIDYDLFIISDVGGTFTNEDKTVLNGVSYNYSFNTTCSAFIGAGLGFHRFEKFEVHRLGETDKYVYAGIGGKFGN